MRPDRIGERVLNDPVDLRIGERPPEAGQDGNCSADISQRARADEGDTIRRIVWGGIHVVQVM